MRRVLFNDRMREDVGWTSVGVGLVASTPCLPCRRPHLPQNRDGGGESSCTLTRTSDIPQLHVVSQGASSLLQIHSRHARAHHLREVRNQTVSECCVGYVSLYGKCVSSCPTCLNMNCDTSRNCTCAPGYIGSFCNQTCEVGKWGDRCSEACICRVGEDCDPVSGSCTPSTSTPTPPSTTHSTVTAIAAVSNPSSSSTTTPLVNSTPLTTRNTPTTTGTTKYTLTTPNTFVNLTLTEPTTSAEDLSDFNVISKPRTNDSVKLVNNMNNDVGSLNALGDLDYPILPTDSATDTFNDVQPDHEPTKNFVVNSLSENSSVVNDRWISELSAHSSVTLGSALGLLALLVVTISGIIRCRNSKPAQHQVSKAEKNSLHLVARNSHYAVPGPPAFSFINGYDLDLTTGVNEDTYDHPRSVRCLVANEPVYDELRY